MIQETSLESFMQILPELGDRQQQVLDCIRNHISVSNREISSILGLPINSVTPRVKELRDLGFVVCCDIKKDEVTNRNVMCWRIKT